MENIFNIKRKYEDEHRNEDDDNTRITSAHFHADGYITSEIKDSNKKIDLDPEDIPKINRESAKTSQEKIEKDFYRSKVLHNFKSSKNKSSIKAKNAKTNDAVFEKRKDRQRTVDELKYSQDTIFESPERFVVEDTFSEHDFDKD